MPQCQFPVFCCFCVSEKLHKKYSRNWTKQKLKSLITWHEDGVQMRARDGPGPATPYGGVGQGVTSQDFIKFWGNFFAFVLLCWLKFHRDLKTFWVYLKDLLENHFKLSIISWKTHLRKWKFSNTILFLSNLCKHICTGSIYKMIYFK
jgi:hypothetical protein